MSVKGFKLTDGTIVRYDYESLDNVVVDNTLTVSGAAADSKTVGDSIDGISGSLGNLSNLDTTAKTSLVGAINEIEAELSGIGEIVGSANESVGVSVTSGTSTVVGEITLTPGKWVLIYGAEFSPANATGERRLDVGTSDTSAPGTSRWSARTNGISSGYNNKFRTMFLNVAEETTYYLWGYQNSGSTLTFYIVFRAICIKAPSNSEVSSEAVSAGTIAQIQADIANLQMSIDNLNGNFTSGTWTPHIYDYETLVRSIGTGHYRKIGNMVFAYFNLQNVDYSGISTMLQFRNLPLNMIVMGGTFYNANMTNSGGHETIQMSERGVYLRPNITSSAWSNPTTTGWTSLSVYGYIPS